MKRIVTFAAYFVIPVLVLVAGVRPVCAQTLNHKRGEINYSSLWQTRNTNAQQTWTFNRNFFEQASLRSSSLRKETLIRVRLANKLKSATIETSGPVYIYKAGSKTKQKIANPAALSVEIVKGKGLRLRNSKVKQPAPVVLTATDEIIIDPSLDTTLTFAGHTYKGVFHLLLWEGTIRVVEHNNVDDYLLGVVHPEMSTSAPLEALKAQAIAARSFALTKREVFKGVDFDVVDTTADQRYIGIGKVTAKVNRAVKETSGLVLKKDGKMLLSLYHANCGGTTSKVPSDYCYFGSASMPGTCCGGCTSGVQSGHGFGMCQNGAINDANKQHGFRYILNHYYKGANISKVY